MDVLSSQANLAGYRAVIEAAEFGKAFPMMMTAAGTVAPGGCAVMRGGRRQPSGNRHGAAPGRYRQRDRRSSGRQGTGEQPGATLSRSRTRSSSRRKPPPAMPKPMSPGIPGKQAALIAETI